MITSRTAQIPIDHMVAEVAAFPLSSEAAFETHITEMDAELGPPSSTLWREAERRIFGGFPAVSVEEAVGIRDKVWFAGRGRERWVRMGDYLRRIARMFLEAKSDAAMPGLPDALGDLGTGGSGPRAARARRTWRWVSFALPSDLLIAALDDTLGPYELRTVSPAVDRLLRDGGFAETHLHLGAGMPFSNLWVGLLHALARPELRSSAFSSPGAALEEGSRLAEWLVRGAVARYVLAAYLHDRDSGATLAEFLSLTVKRRLGDPSGYSLLVTGLAELGRGELSDGASETFPAWKDLYSRLTRVTTARPSQQYDSFGEADPIAPFFTRTGLYEPTPEMRFVSAGLTRMKDGAEDRLFELLFWQTVRIRSIFYRHVVQRPMTPGLQWFIRFYGRIRHGREPAMSVGLQVESAARTSGAGMGLKSLEIRTSPARSTSDLISFLNDVDGATAKLEEKERKEHRHFEACVVLHFTKDRGGRALSGLPAADWLWSHADPGARVETDRLTRDVPPAPEMIGNPSGYRYSRFYSLKCTEARAFAGALREYPMTVQVLRGVDVCTDELGVPNWVLAPILGHVHRAADSACRELRRMLTILVPPLRTTVHVGEDFVHLLSGLRRVDEALAHFGMREGDRIGHGLALGVDPRAWVRSAGRVPLAREERLFDLAWEWTVASKYERGVSADRLHSINREIHVLSEQIFGKVLQAVEVAALAEDLFDRYALSRAGFPNGPMPGKSQGGPHGGRRFSLLVDFLTDRSVFLAGREIEWIDPAEEADSLALLQAGLRSGCQSRNRG